MEVDSLAITISALGTAIGVQAATVRQLSSSIVKELRTIRALLDEINRGIKGGKGE